MLTIIETPTFQRLWPAYWSEEERAEFAAYLAHSPEIGDVVKSSGACARSDGAEKAVENLVACE